MTKAVLDRTTGTATDDALARTLPLDVEQNINKAAAALLEGQRPDGHWVFELEADATIPAEYVLFRHYLGEPVDAALEAKIAMYLRRTQGEHGGWPLLREGDVDKSATVKAYFALKMIGDSIDADHMRRAREAVRTRGGAANANVFTRIMLALFGFIPWHAVPVMPVEIMLLPKWFPFHLDKISYWSRTVIVPLLVLFEEAGSAQRKGRADRRTFPRTAAHPRSGGQGATTESFVVLVLSRGRHRPARKRAVLSARTRRRAIDQAVAWVTERLNGEDGLGAIFPAMANSVMMFAVLGYPEDHPLRAIARKSVEKLWSCTSEEAYCQPCVSPIWDTGLTAHALLEVGGERAIGAVKKGLDWLVPQQVLDVRGDWIRGGLIFGPAAGRSNMLIRIIPMLTTPPSSPWPWIGPRIFPAARTSIRALRARGNGSSACRVKTAPGARSMPTTSTTT